jgi:electron transfer flavoprotein alpha subunit
VIAPKAELLASLVAADVSPAGRAGGRAPRKARKSPARLAIKTGSGLLTDAVDIGDGLVAEQSIFGGAIVVNSRVTAGIPIIAVRPNATTRGARAGSSRDRAGRHRGVTDAAKGARITERVVQEEGRAPGTDRGFDRGLRRPRRGSTPRTGSP